MTKEERGRYMASPEWAQLKEQVKKRARGWCERCARSSIDNVHHLTYERLGHERLEDLQGLCEPCHLFISAKSDYDPHPVHVMPFGPFEHSSPDVGIASILGYATCCFPEDVVPLYAYVTAAHFRDRTLTLTWNEYGPIEAQMKAISDGAKRVLTEPITIIHKLINGEVSAIRKSSQ